MPTRICEIEFYALRFEK